MSVVPSTVHPFVKWGQNETHVFISVQLSDSENVQVTIGDETLNFSAIGNGSHGRVPYSFVLDYYLPVVSKQSRYTITGRAVIFKLRKEFKETWPRLNCQPERLPWTRLDFDLYQFDASDLEGSEPETGNVDLKVIQPSKEERELHNAEMKKLEYEEKWEAFLKILKHPLTIYLSLFNLLQFAGFLYVFGKLTLSSLQLDGSNETAEWYNEAVLRLIVAQLLAFLEPIHITLGWVPGSVLASALQVYGRSLILFFIVIPHDHLHATDTVFWLFFAWSAIELVRYPYYICSLFGFRSGLLTYLRHTLWIPLYPIGFVCEDSNNFVACLITVYLLLPDLKWSDLERPTRSRTFKAALSLVQRRYHDHT
ncbi:unnamed protein product [Dicrocoelium dendriticum]|nr:unnamed protein product [Dicrocoelium dendriticum]